MTSLTSSNAVLLARIERERRARLDQRSAAQLEDAIEAARAGDPRPFVRIQWPTADFDPWQWYALEGICSPADRGVWVKGNTGCGKGAVGGAGCCLYFTIWPDARIRVTRDNYDNAVQIAFGEIDKWWRRMRYPPEAKLLTAAIDGGKNHEILVLNPRHEEGFHGVHAEHVLFWFDEATAANLETRFDAAMTQAHKVVATANPRTRAGKFRSQFPKANPNKNQVSTTLFGRQRLITVSGADCRNVREKRLKRPEGPIGGIEIAGTRYEHGQPIPHEAWQTVAPLVPGQVCYDEWLQHANHPSEFHRRVFALGEFPDEDPELQVVPTAGVDRSMSHGRWLLALLEASRSKSPEFRTWFDRRYPLSSAFGLDVAASADGDETILVGGGAAGVAGIHGCQFRDTTQTVEWVLATTRKIYGVDLTRGGTPIGIDYGGGYGNAVGDPLRKRGCRVIEIRGGVPSDVAPAEYGNKRAELYGTFGQRLDPLGDWADSPLALPDDPMLAEELLAPQKVFIGNDGSRYYITPKNRRGSSEGFKGATLHEILGRSPDRGDAVVYWWEALRHVGADLSEWLESGAF